VAAEVVSLESNGGARRKTPAQWHRHWAKEYAAFQKRSRKFFQQGIKVQERYEDERKSASNEDPVDVGISSRRLNLFHSNITTLQSMLYGSVPKIEVSREHADPDDDVARVAALMLQRILEADVATSGSDLATTLRAALQDRLLPGLGTARVRYTFSAHEEAVNYPEGMEAPETPLMRTVIDNEEAPLDYVHWQDFAWGWCRTWSELPWMGFRSWLEKYEVEDRFGEDIAKTLEYKKQGVEEGQNSRSQSDPEQDENIEKAEIWEFWCKEGHKVYWWSPGASQILDVRDDPLGLRGFWPSPMPMAANLTTKLFMPKADFVISQDLYNEIDELQTRISIITRAIKVVGVYDKSAGESVGRMLKEGVENDLIPVDNWALFAEKGGLKGVIDWFPVEQVVGVLQTLQQVQSDKIEQLYQVTGLADILRGGNQQYTAADTERLKAKFGSIRVQMLQEDFARFASELDQLKAEVVSKHFEPKSILLQSNAMHIAEADRQLLPPALGLIKSPEIFWRVNIRPESIAMADYAQVKAERSEFLNSMATYIQSSQAMAQAVPGSLAILLQFLKWGMAGYKGAKELEGIMDRAIEQAMNMPMPDQGEQQRQQQQMDMQKAQMEHQMEMQRLTTKHQGDMQLLQMKMQGELKKIVDDHMTKMEQQQSKRQADLEKIAADLQADLTLIQANLSADISTEQAQAENAAAEQQVEHENNVVEMELEHEFNLQEMGADAEIQADQDRRRLQDGGGEDGGEDGGQ